MLKMTKKIVFIDMDGVLANFHKGIGRPYESEPEEMHIPGFYRSLEPMPGAKEAIAKLVRMQHLDMWVATKPSTVNLHSASEKLFWLTEHFPVFLKKSIITCNKGLLKGDYLIDDSPKRWKKKFQGDFIHFDHCTPESEWFKLVNFFEAIGKLEHECFTDGNAQCVTCGKQF